jgi:hypothetical protein
MKKIPAKQANPGIPTSCDIGKIDIHNSLCGLGAGVSVMHFSLYKRLWLRDYSPTSICLQMLNKIIKQLVGTIEDVQLRIDKHVIPTDIIILEIPEDEK